MRPSGLFFYKYLNSLQSPVDITRFKELVTFSKMKSKTPIHDRMEKLRASLQNSKQTPTKPKETVIASKIKSKTPIHDRMEKLRASLQDSKSTLPPPSPSVESGNISSGSSVRSEKMTASVKPQIGNKNKTHKKEVINKNKSYLKTEANQATGELFRSRKCKARDVNSLKSSETCERILQRKRKYIEVEGDQCKTKSQSNSPEKTNNRLYSKNNDQPNSSGRAMLNSKDQAAKSNLVVSAIKNSPKTLKRNEKMPSPKKNACKNNSVVAKERPFKTDNKASVTVDDSTYIIKKELDQTAKKYKIPKVSSKSEGIAVDPNNESANYEQDDMEIDSLQSSPICNFQDEVEEMDWEPDKVATEVNEARKTLLISDRPHPLSNLPEFTHSKKLADIGDSCDFFIVIDTNVYISSLPFVKKLLDIKVPGMGSPVTYVPHRVLKELDGLKSKKFNDSSVVPSRAREAIGFINSCLKQRPDSMKGQTIADYMAMSQLGFDDLVSDDKILLSCLQIQDAISKKAVILLSDDKNLRNKALVEGLPTFSTSEFKAFISKTGLNCDLSPETLQRNYTEYRIKAVLHLIINEILKTECCEVQNCLSLAVSKLVEKWSPAFSHKFPVIAEEDLLCLRKHLQSVDEGKPHYSMVLDYAQRFFSHFCIKGKPYFNQVQKAVSVLENFKTEISQLDEPPVEKKYYYGALESILGDCWTSVNAEFSRLSLAVSNNNGSFSLDRIDKDIECVSAIVDGLKGVLSESILTVETSAKVPQVAKALAACSKGEEGHYLNIILKCCTTHKGRDLLSRAKNIFQSFLNNFLQGRTYLI